MRIDPDEDLEDFLDSMQFEVEPGDVWGDSSNLYVVVQHEECGCTFLRAVALVGSAAYQLIAQRDQELQDYFLDAQFDKLGHIDGIIQYLDLRSAPKRTSKKTKKAVKTKTSKKSRF